MLWCNSGFQKFNMKTKRISPDLISPHGSFNTDDNLNQILPVRIRRSVKGTIAPLARKKEGKIFPFNSHEQFFCGDTRYLQDNLPEYVRHDLISP